MNIVWSENLIIFAGLLLVGVLLWIVQQASQKIPRFILLMAELMRGVGAVGVCIVEIKQYWATLELFWKIAAVMVAGLMGVIVALVFVIHMLQFVAGLRKKA